MGLSLAGVVVGCLFFFLFPVSGSDGVITQLADSLLLHVDSEFVVSVALYTRGERTSDCLLSAGRKTSDDDDDGSRRNEETNKGLLDNQRGKKETRRHHRRCCCSCCGWLWQQQQSARRLLAPRLRAVGCVRRSSATTTPPPASSSSKSSFTTTTTLPLLRLRRPVADVWRPLLRRWPRPPYIRFNVVRSTTTTTANYTSRIRVKLVVAKTKSS